jgi:hypothetical protein
MTLLEWLKRAPQPKCVELNGKRISVATGRKRWSQLAETIQTMGRSGDTLIALDASGEVLRSVVYDGEGGTDTAEEPAQVVKGESEAVQLMRVLAESNDRAVMRYEGMQRETLQTLQGLVSEFSGAMTAALNAWSTQVQETARVTATLVQVTAERDAALNGEGGSMLEGIAGPVVKQMIGGALMAGAAPAPAASANGKANGHKKGAH